MKAFQTLALVLIVLLLAAAPAVAQTPAGETSLLGSSKYAIGVGVALTIIGAAFGFGKIGSAALDGMARQPEVAGDIRGAMIVIAALLEGATFFGLLICLLTLFV
ncbi:MAG: ATP synthase F0 subunit C [Gemmataceae bacterium]|nr:ATP synthase F0 subunit C [Gemmataceae bacterium]